MKRAVGLLVAGLLCVGTLAGCCAAPRRPVSRPPGEGSAEGKVTGPISLPSLGQPTPIALTSLALPSHQAVEKALAKKSAASGHRLLLETQCQCTAAAESSLGNLLAAERQSALTGSAGRRDRDAQSRSVLADVLGLRAVEERNRSAASAMELYYRLAAAHFNRDRVDRSLEEVRRTVENFRKAKDTGLSVPGDEARLLNQETELVDRRVQLETGLEQLEGQLCQLLGLDAAPDQPLWPGADMTVNVSPVDVEAAVAEGLRSRPDLAELCVLRENASEETLRSIRGALARVDPLLGLASSAKHMVCPAKHRARVSLETQTRREQLDDLLEFQKRSAEGEIRRAAGDVEARLRRIGLAKDKLDQCQALWRRLRERREAKGTVQASEISAAQLEVLRAESEAFQAVVEWKIALVKLKQSQGLLAAECGYTLPAACCDGCLDAPRGRVTP